MAKKSVRVRVIYPFYDVQTGQRYEVGTELAGWDLTWARWCEERGLVEIISIEARPTRGKPGPSTTKPKAGPKEEK